MHDFIGQTIKGYEIRQQLGAGGFGAVFRAYQAAVEREVAIKVILPEHASHPDFIRNFEAEAQLVARLEHPHIVPLFDYWRDPEGAYLVMRLLRGGSLRDRLKQGKLAPGDAVRIIEQVAAALATAHLAGVIHRDIKPDNILMDESGNAYLSDFGIAKRITEATDRTEGITGSITHMAPEQLQYMALSPQTDIYSLGIVIYQMVTGQHPFPDLSISQMIQKHLYEPLPEVTQPELDAVIKQATMKTPAERYPDTLALAAAFRRALQGEHLAPASSSVDLSIVANPYKGLRAFDEADALDFFGREALVERLLNHMKKARFLAVVGPSGSGKSSVVKAGVIPMLRKGQLTGSERWYMLEMLPGLHPLQALETALLSIALKPPKQLLDQLSADRRGLIWGADRVLSDNSDELLLVIDQFEELFTLTENEAERLQFLSLLYTAVTEPESRVRVVVTLRADFIDKPLQYAEFGELLRQNIEFVLPLLPDEIERAVSAPAQRVGIGVDPELIAAVVADVREEPGALPLLQYALYEVFEQRAGYSLSLNAYTAMGGVTGALARRAEEVYQTLARERPDGQELVRQVFLRLITLGEGTEDTRRRVRRSELNLLGDVSGLLDAFGAARLLTFDRDPITREPTIEVAHEALIREWERLREWLDTSRTDVRAERQLMTATQEWLQSNQDEGFLLSGSRLAQFELFAAETTLMLTPDEQAYLAASLAQRARQRAEETVRQQHELELEQRSRRVLQALVAVLLIAMLGAFGLSAFALNQSQDAQNARGTSDVNVTRALAAQDTAISAEDTAVYDANNAGTQAANATQAQGRALDAADFARTQAFNAQAARGTSDANATIAITNEVSAFEQATTVALERDRANTGATQVANERNYAEGLRLAGISTDILEDFLGAEVALLMGIRSLNQAYSIEGDVALQQALDNHYLMHLNNVSPYFGITVSISPDERYYAVGLTNLQPEGVIPVQMYDLQTGALVATFEAHTQGIIASAFNPDGTLLVTGSHDQTAIIWDVAAQSVRHVLEGHTSSVNDVQFSADGRWVLTGCADGTARLWEVETGKEIMVYDAGSPIWGAVIDSSGENVLAVAEDGAAHLWDTSSGDEIEVYQGYASRDDQSRVAFSPNDDTVVTTITGTAYVWDVSSGELELALRAETGYIYSVAYDAVGDIIITANRDGTSRLWDATNGREIMTLDGPNQTVYEAAISTSGRYVVSVGLDGSIRVYDRTGGSRFNTFLADTTLQDVVVSSDNRYIAATNQDSQRLLIDLTTLELIDDGRERDELLTPEDTLVPPSYIDELVFISSENWPLIETLLDENYIGDNDRALSSPDGRYLVTVEDERAVLWNVAEQTALMETNNAPFIRFSTNGQYLTMLDEEAARLRVWQSDTGALLATIATGLELDERGGPTGIGPFDNKALAVSNDGRWVALGDMTGRVQVWEVSSGSLLHTLLGHTSGIWCLDFSPDSHFLLSSSGGYIATQGNILVSFDPGTTESTARLWNLDTGREDRRFVFASPVTQVYFTADQTALVTVSGGVLRVWDADYRALVAYACSQAVRDLTEVERGQYAVGEDRTCPNS